MYASRIRAHSWLIQLSFIMIVSAGIVLPAFAQQFDAPYYMLQERNKEKWAAEDKEIDTKLAELKKKYGTPPSIIYVLADDVGWGELGWQGGGKHRGTPTPELDKMAHEGMRF